jgi:hypothetical protein
MIGFTENLPVIEPGCIDKFGQIINMISGEIYTKAYND